MLGQLSQLHQMLTHLLESVPEPDAYRTFAPDVPPLAWLLGRAVYVETWWLREALAGDDDLTARVRHLFAGELTLEPALWQQLPPREHLLNWAAQAHDENLMRLANPGMLPPHAELSEPVLLFHILQEYARLYELTLAQLNARRLQEPEGQPYRPAVPLTLLPPSTEHVDVHRGHYRIGAKTEPALDNELPPQVVELDAFRIDRTPVTNGAWLGFIEAGGYQERSYWDDDGWAWLTTAAPSPQHWRQDEAGAWYGLGVNGPFDLAPADPISGISHFEAQAYACWVASLGGPLAGAVVQHEYQWEVATRSRAITEFGRVWEWCANPFHPYTGYEAPAYAEAATRSFGAGHYALRGGSLHTQAPIRRPSFRQHAVPEQRALFSGVRLVFPASEMPWHSGSE